MALTWKDWFLKGDYVQKNLDFSRETLLERLLKPGEKVLLPQTLCPSLSPSQQRLAFVPRVEREHGEGRLCGGEAARQGEHQGITRKVPVWSAAAQEEMYGGTFHIGGKQSSGEG